MNYDMLIIGGGRDAVQTALNAARGGKIVALIKRNRDAIDATNTDVLRRAASRLDTSGGTKANEMWGKAVRMLADQWLVDQVELERLGVDVLCGDVRFIDDRTVEVHQVKESGDGRVVLTASHIVLGCDTCSVRPGHVRFDSNSILDVESLLKLDRLPESIIVVGAGETGLDYALLLGSLGVDVTVVDEKASVFDVYGGLMNDQRLFEMQSLDISFRLGDEVIGIDRKDGTVVVRLASGKAFVAQAALVCVGRRGETDSLNLEITGVGLDERGRIWCDANGGTWASHISAVGKVVGFRPTSVMAG